jgi:Lar family restriction alleviation protein
VANELKSCPFCGSNHVALRRPPHQNFVECLDCYASARDLPTDLQAIAAWNTRAALASHAKRTSTAPERAEEERA